ncbi:MAG: carbohydrate binding domain-containing protein [Bacteroidota bacterium]
MKPLLLFFLILGYILYGHSQPFSNGYPFYLPSNDSLSREFLPDFPASPIGPEEAIGINSEGDFVIKGEPIRFWGVNLTARGAFPPKNKANEIAARMRKMGINLVRFHHLDNPWAGNDGSIFLNGQGTRNLNATTLDRMEFLIAAFKRNGIYVNMNLNVSRTFQEQDGVVNADSLVDFAKAVTTFDPWLITLQEEYADQLLSHVNPYTGLALKDDPVLAMVETINENTLYGFWKGDRLRAFSAGGSLIRRHVELLDSLWHEFLLDKYQDDASLTASWNTGSVASGQGNQVQDGGFESGNLNQWTMETHSTAQATSSLSTTSPFAGSSSAEVDVTHITGTDWHVQFYQGGLSMNKDSVYAVTFAARSDANRNINIGVQQNVSPWDYYGGSQYALTPVWQTFTFTFVAPTDLQGELRIGYNFANQTGKVWFDDISLASPSKSGLQTGESLIQRNIKRILYGERLSFTDQRIADQAEFYIKIQREFLQGMYNYLKALGISAPITGTNALVGPADAMHQQDLDYIDDHNYWDHPWFPSTPWDPYDWLLRNEAALKDPGIEAMSNIFSGLAIDKKPYTVSEYNHPFPNRYQVEMVPMLTSYASFHGADGLMFFEYEGGSDWDTDIVDGFFSINRNTALMSLFPACAYAYRSYKIAEASHTYLIEYSPEFVWESPLQDNSGRWGKWLPYDPTLALTHNIRTVGYQGSSDPDLAQLPPPSSSNFLSSTGQIRLQTDLGLHSTFAAGYVSITGFLQDATHHIVGNLQLQQANDFGALSWIALSGDSLLTAERSLLTLSSRLQNTNMQWDGTRTVHNNWGSPPTLMQPLTVQLRLNIQADSVRLYPLDETGLHSSYQTLLPIGPNLFDLTLDQSTDQTPWYGLEAIGKGIPLQQDDLVDLISLRVFPNPAKEYVIFQYSTDRQDQAFVELYDLLGKLIQVTPSEHSSVEQQLVLPIDELSAGVYHYRFHLGNRSSVGKLIVE